MFRTCFGGDLGVAGLRQPLLQLRVDEGVRVDDAEEHAVDREAANHDHPGPETAVGRLDDRALRLARVVLVVHLSAHRAPVCLSRNRVLHFVHSPQLPDRRVNRYCRALGQKGIALTRIGTVAIGLTTANVTRRADWIIRGCAIDRSDRPVTFQTEAADVPIAGLLADRHRYR